MIESGLFINMQVRKERLMKIGELIAFILYFMIVLGMGVYFFVRGRKDMGEKSFFLGGRKMGGVVAQYQYW